MIIPECGDSACRGKAFSDPIYVQSQAQLLSMPYMAHIEVFDDVDGPTG